MTSIGQLTEYDGDPYTIIGVMPAGFTLPMTTRALDQLSNRSDVWLPAGLEMAGAPFGLLRAGVSADDATRELQAIANTAHMRWSARVTHAPGRCALRISSRRVKSGPSRSCSPRSAYCCSSPAPTWRTCCSCAHGRGAASSRFAWASAPDVRGSFAWRSPRVCCSRSSPGRWAC